MSKKIPASLNLVSPDDDRIIEHYQSAGSRKGRTELRYLLELGAIVKEAGVGDLLMALDKQAGPEHAVACISKVKATMDESLKAISAASKDSSPQPETIETKETQSTTTSELPANHPFAPSLR